MSLALNEYILDDIVNITSNKVDTKNLVLQQYISTENMLPDRKGISLAASMPLGKVNQFLKNDTLFSNIRTYFRKVWFSSFDGGSSPDVLIFRAKDVEVLDPRFLYYLISDQKFIDYSDKTSKGAKMPRGDKSAILNYKTYLPALSIQKRISQILSDLDDKIHLNNQINQTLESIAQAIFKSWFVDFEPVRAKITAKQTGQDPEFAAMCAISGKSEAELEQMAKEDFAELQATAALFPDELIESELGEVPKGWEVSNFKGFCKKIESGGTPKRSELHYWNGEIRWLSSGEVRETVVLDTKEKITKTGLLNSSAKLWEKYTTVIAMYGATAGQVCLLANEMAANQACCGLIPKDEFKSFAFLIARNSVRSLSDKASGSAQQNLNKGIIENQPCVLPRLSVARNFENLVFPLLRKWLANSEENIRLSVIRDSLLPKLLSGEVDVSGLQDEGIDG
ncbi:restriction endonuclease subunit S [Acinetobacter venetianus]|uniref:restriction endonuclease subunit S n=1 Tax=Acinetobacter venetianus TaxID=52133 RepID=UPI00384BEB08